MRLKNRVERLDRVQVWRHRHDLACNHRKQAFPSSGLLSNPTGGRLGR